MLYYNIEFLRLIFTVAILLGHMALINLFSGQTIAQNYIANYSICVEFFFIIAGYFFFNEVKKTNNSNSNNEIINFITRKFSRLMPIFIFVLILQILFSTFHIIEQRPYLKQEFLKIFFIHEIGINYIETIPLKNNFYTTNVPAWFIAVYFWISLFYFYLLKNFNNKKVHFSMILITYLSFLFYLRVPTLFYVYKLLRGFYSFGIGYFFGMFCNWYRNNYNIFDIKRKTKIIFTIIEIIALSQIFKTIFIKQYINDLNLYFIIMLCILLFSFIFNKGYIGQLLNHKIFGFMGKYCYSIYMIQYIIQITIAPGNKLMQTQFYSSFRSNYPNIDLITSIIIIILSGVLAYYFVEKPSKKYLNNKFGAVLK